MLQRRRELFAAIVAVSVLSAVAYIGITAASARAGGGLATPESAQGRVIEGFATDLGASPTSTAAPIASASASAAVVGTSTAAATPTPARGYVVFLDARNPSDPRVAVAPLDAPDGPRDVTDVSCSRVYFAAGKGLCLVERGGLTFRTVGQVLDGRLQPVAEFRAMGLASRVRLSPDARYGVATVFTAGHSYAVAGAFSTRTEIIDMAANRPIYDLENSLTTRDGRVFRQPEFNFWGVTFTADSNKFYATLNVRDQWLLVEGNVAERSARVIYDGPLECPSISPDGTRLAFKRRNADGTTWSLYVLDLRTMRESPVAGETRSIDDQAEWLDNGHLLYSVITPNGGSFRYDTWVAAVDGSEPARLFMRDAYSPVVVRGGSSLRVAPQ